MPASGRGTGPAPGSEADAWRDPAARRDFQARVSRYLTDGPPPAPSGSAARNPASATASPWELDGPADRELAGLSQLARKALAEFMDAAVLVNPAG
jgi:hypothetical protein